MLSNGGEGTSCHGKNTCTVLAFNVSQYFNKTKHNLKVLHDHIMYVLHWGPLLWDCFLTDQCAAVTWENRRSAAESRRASAGPCPECHTETSWDLSSVLTLWPPPAKCTEDLTQPLASSNWPTKNTTASKTTMWQTTNLFTFTSHSSQHKAFWTNCCQLGSKIHSDSVNRSANNITTKM